jgi:hypothetical protein
VAIVTQPLGSSEARGSVGGLTYSTWRGKHCVRTRAGPSREPTEDQLIIIGLTTKYAAFWNQLTDAQRAAWRAYAAQQRDPHWTGQDKRLTGHNWFVRLNVRLDLLTEGYCPDPPVFPIDDYIDTITFGVIGNDWAMGWHDPQNHAPWQAWLDLWLAGPFSPGRNPTLHDADRKLSQDVTNLACTLSELAVGTYTFFWRILDDHGQATPFEHDRFTIVAP